jgi:hypothetical protein
VLRHLEDHLKGEFMTGAHCLCSPEFYDALTYHAKVKDAFTYLQQGAVLINDMRAGFTFGGLTFEDYRGQATDVNGVTRRFIAAGEAHVFPLGTVDAFSTYFAPAEFMRHILVPHPSGALRACKSAFLPICQRDGQHPGPGALRQAGTAEVRARHRSSHPVQPAAHVPPAGRAGEADGGLIIERLYEAAARAGLLKEAVWVPAEGAEPQTVSVDFRAPDDTVLDGLGLSTDYSIRYPAGRFLGLASGDRVTVNGEGYRVREVRAVGDGSEKRASLTRL